MQVVWFKRDLRVQDHRALAQAARHGPVLPLYVIEPELWRQPDASARHWGFVADCLRSLDADLSRFGVPLVIRRGEIIDILADLQAQGQLTALWSHEETGNGWTYVRDRRVAAWCRANGLRWHELRNFGVQRRMASRNGWAEAWDRFMAEPQTPAPHLPPQGWAPTGVPTAASLGLPADPCPERQRGGRVAGLDRLDSFLTTRGRDYRQAMSSPLEGATACSRLSPHLAWGSLSLREVTQATWARQAELRAADDPRARAWRGAMHSFSGRLHWHCHFIQKLEDDPAIEVRNLHPAYDGLRPAVPDATRLAAWAQGETGLPFLDACMRCLRATGWLNFRMRAMVMACASYHLWLDWRAPGLELARLFTDYEPGIHWSQVQMQSGTTGINTPRIYNPVKQGYDQDPTGAFTRRWLPELAPIADAHLQEPWKAENAGQVLGKAYPFPIVDPLAAARDARDRIWAIRRSDGFRDAAKAVLAKHGSRKGRRPKHKKPAPAQLTLPL